LKAVGDFAGGCRGQGSPRRSHVRRAVSPVEDVGSPGIPAVVHNEKCSRRSWLQADFVVDRISEPLLAAQISLRGLNADMSEQKLDLLKLSACLMTQSGTGSAEIVRRNAIQTTFRGPRLYDAPYDFRTETACRDPAGLVDRPKNRAG
jgi:hypothetical protein